MATAKLHQNLADERQGDFSQSLNIDGGLRTIYDPFSTQFDPATGAVTRTPFPDNKIPQNRFYSLSAVRRDPGNAAAKAALEHALAQSRAESPVQ